MQRFETDQEREERIDKENNAAKEVIRVWIIDDSAHARAELNNILRNEGYLVIGSSASYNEFMEAPKGDANIFIVDMVMPQKSGLELCAAIKDRVRSCYIIILSVLAPELVIEDLISAGANDFLEKPVLPIDLLSSVEKMGRRIISDGKL